MTTLDIIKSAADIEAAETKTLIEFYNEFNADKPVKKFADRATAIKRCVALYVELVEEGQISDANEAKAPKAKKEKAVKVEAPEAESAPEAAASEEDQAVTNDSFTWPFANKNVKSSPTGTPSKATDSKAKTEVKPKRAISNASNAAGISASWADPETAAARLTRNAVTVTVKGKTTEHKSTRAAFRHYRLMDSKHIRFRGILKAAGSAVYTENNVEYTFTIV